MECLVENVLTFVEELAFILKASAVSVDQRILDADDTLANL
ncbi:MAG: hypothetical protein ACYCYO_07055 [Bacilli bacterium]